ncbi:MAG: hypothetical protein L0Y66_22750 [Myxococcaceae bacterium]|nr:hypothetical protein [Myxococcaceae bacterium]MCI0672470.1 hypothetical protein [Myxococcaceae bacterium]
MRVFLVSVLLLASAACVDGGDNPSKVEDLRVLAMRVEPAELMAPSCDPGTLPALTTPISFRALVVDPKGETRPVRASLTACSKQSDRDCNEEDSVRLVMFDEELASEELVKGEFTRMVEPTSGNVGQYVEDLARVLVAAAEADTYKGLGGIRLPLVLHVSAGEEEIFAQKLMVFSCPRVEGQAQNVNPELPGLLLEGADWAEAGLPELSGAGPFDVEPLDFSDREEAYVVPSLAFPPEPVHLTESWKISWHTDYGRMEPQETGGTDLGGFAGRHQVQWLPPANDPRPQERVRVWAVVRDGRGGQSWLERSFRYAP